jgi:hypothetical protein
LVAVAILASAAFYQSALIGWWRGEAKYKGRYRNYWHAELREYSWYGFWNPSAPYGRFAKREPDWKEWTALLTSGERRPMFDLNPPLQDGDPNAVPVLIELLDAKEEHVRLLAARGLKRIGPRADVAVPELLAHLGADGMVPRAIWEALKAVSPDSAKEIRKPVAPREIDW